MTQPFTKRNKVSLVCNGDEFVDTCCRLVGEASEKVLFHTYAFEVDDITQPFIDALLRKGGEGVPVYMIIDAFGSGEISSKLKKRFAQSNIHFCYFAPFISKRLENIGRRLHQKVLVIDNNKALVGGINHGRLFIKPQDGTPWLDYAALLEGEEVFRLQKKVSRLYQRYFPEQWWRLKNLIGKVDSPPQGNVLVRTNVNDFMRFRSEIYRSQLRAIRTAKVSVQLFATYFLPGKKLLKELKRAVRRGVAVELIFGAYSDHPTERWSSKYLYNWYLKNDITVYEWNKSVIHGKVALIDGQWVTIGSYNHNHLSRYINLELNLEIWDKEFADHIADEIARIKQQCIEITEDDWRENTTVLQSLLYLGTYMLANMMGLISTLLIIRRKKSRFNG